jgi:hypothetical protein
MEMLHSALGRKFKEPLLSPVRELVERVAIDTEL